MARPKVTFAEVFGYLLVIGWNVLIVLVTIVAFAKSESAFQTLTFSFLVVIYIHVTLLSHGVGYASEEGRFQRADALFRLRLLLHDVVTAEEKAARADEETNWGREERKVIVRFLIRYTFSGLLFLIAAWQFWLAVLR